MTIPCEGSEIPLAVRTDDARFEDLAGFPFQPNYVEVHNPYGEPRLRMHYVDEGPRDARLGSDLPGARARRQGAAPPDPPPGGPLLAGGLRGRGRSHHCRLDSDDARIET